jgi:ABC-2 type transport system permease protein
VIYEEAIILLCMVIWGIARGSDSISGELGRGTMEMLLAQPVSRLQVLLHQAAVTVGGVVLLAAVTWFGTFVGVQTLSAREPKPQPTFLAKVLRLEWPFTSEKEPKSEKQEYIYVPLREKVDTRHLLPGAVNLFALGFFIAALSTLVSAFDRYRWRVIGIVVGIYVIELILKAVGVALKDWNWLCYLTFFTAYEPQYLVQIAVEHPTEAWSFVRTAPLEPNARHVLAGLGPLGFCSILWALGLACYAGAAARFCTRDLPPPL